MTPQLPQFAGSVSMLEQTLPKPRSLQRTLGGRQAQTLFSHWSPVSQTLPQPPQFSGSSVTFAQVPPQTSDGFAQVLVHWLLLQNSPRGQTVPQLPQLSGSVAVLVQLPLQLVWPVRQPHWELVQTPLWHMVLQLPQA
jgi:hypothetical protein